MTIKDVAKYSGVSITTISRVLNNHPDVREEVRAKVL
ncbi:MAG: LacI family DNA-binding transcriptional regulator, partial [Clostridia bacterium]|nr:LacI family DNA-binding transcriptional regulator [Clostridia bacterium]